MTDERDAAGAEPHVNGSHSTTNGHSPAQPLSAASPDAALPIASSSNHYAPASLPEPSSAAPPASNNPMARLAKLEASRPASAAPSSPTSATTTAATVAPLPAPPPSPTPQVAPARASVPVGRPSIPLFSSLSLSARKPANGDAASPGGGGARGRITSFGSLRERFSSRSTRGKNVQRDEDGPPALPPKDGQYGAPTPIHERETQTAASPAVKAAAAARRTSELFPIGVDNGPSFASAFTPAPAAPTTTTTTTADADARAKQEWDDAYDDGYAYDLSPPSAPLAPVVELGRELEPAPSPTAAPAAPAVVAAVEDDGAQENERRVSASTFGRPSSTGVTASSSFDTLGSPPVPPLAARPLPPAASPDVPAAAPAPPIGNGAAPVGESVLHRRRPSHDFHPSPAVSNGFAAADEGPTTAHWLQSREDDRRADDNALLPDAVASRRAASGHGAVAPDPWEALDARRAEREAVRVRVEAEARERKRLRELAAEREAKERVAREEERVRAARERTREVERERREKEEREAREREQVEAARVQREKAREGSVPPETAGAKGGRLADGVSPTLPSFSLFSLITDSRPCPRSRRSQWLTVQAPNTVIFRRRFFHILPSVIHLFKDSTVRSLLPPPFFRGVALTGRATPTFAPSGRAPTRRSRRSGSRRRPTRTWPTRTRRRRCSTRSGSPTSTVRCGSRTSTPSRTRSSSSLPSVPPLLPLPHCAFRRADLCGLPLAPPS